VAKRKRGKGYSVYCVEHRDLSASYVKKHRALKLKEPPQPPCDNVPQEEKKDKEMTINNALTFQQFRQFQQLRKLEDYLQWKRREALARAFYKLKNPAMFEFNRQFVSSPLQMKDRFGVATAASQEKDKETQQEVNDLIDEQMEYES